MNQKNEGENKRSDQPASLIEDDLQTEKQQQNTSKIDRDQMSTE